jgi:hypothetical protein
VSLPFLLNEWWQVSNKPGLLVREIINIGHNAWSAWDWLFHEKNGTHSMIAVSYSKLRMVATG